MEGTMKAARIHEPGEPLQIEEVPIPDIKEDEVLMKVRRAGVNHGDLHVRERGGFDIKPGERANIFPELPMTMGHDGTGEIAAVGDNVTNVEVGDKVVAICHLSCGQCQPCRTGHEQVCEHVRVLGFITWSSEIYADTEDIFKRYKNGTFAEYCRFPATNVHKLEPEDDIDRMAKVSETGIGYRGLTRGDLQPGETVIINGGTGIVGIGAVLWALVKGAAHVIVSARDRDRLEYVRNIDPDRISTFSVTEDPIQETVMDLTDNKGAHMLLDFTPQGIESFHACMESLRPTGRIVIMGGNLEKIEFVYKWFNAYHLSLYSDAGRYRHEYPGIFSLARRGVFDPAPITTEYFDIEETNEALDFLRDYDGAVPKWPMIAFD